MLGPAGLREEYSIVAQEEIIKTATLVHEPGATGPKGKSSVGVGGDSQIQNHAYFGAAEGLGDSPEDRGAEDSQDTDGCGSELWQ